MDYAALEKLFDCTCQDVIKDLKEQYKSDYEQGGPGKLEAFLELIKTSFEKAEAAFLDKHNLGDDKEALHRIRAIAKTYAKKCVGDYSKVKA